MSAWRFSGKRADAAALRLAVHRRQADVVHDVRTAWQAQDAAALAALLTPDVQLLVDSGGRTRLSVRDLAGDVPVATTMASVLSTYPDVVITDAEVNGMPGLKVCTEGTVLGVVSFRLRGRAVSDVWVVVNPDKLRSWSA
ncbi:hypothetical protein JNB62_03380 [Microbacterium jejuense]|uniref:SnoaL-like domain-containing protein n=1 Tax=Microbacterium jejuense TaxID=1263637 RepID=A0ABS7HJ11_9MICO|nr:hypothetical protein [Microbacterium jejuense]MBW9092720.1 hypothetical protein [Microbacterium jejuense]